MWSALKHVNFLVSPLQYRSSNTYTCPAQPVDVELTLSSLNPVGIPSCVVIANGATRHWEARNKVYMQILVCWCFGY